MINFQIMSLSEREQKFFLDSFSIEEFLYRKTKILLEHESVKKSKEFFKIANESFEKGVIRAVLDETKGNIIKSSKILGISRNTLSKKIKALKIR